MRAWHLLAIVAIVVITCLSAGAQQWHTGAGTVPSGTYWGGGQAPGYRYASTATNAPGTIIPPFNISNVQNDTGYDTSYNPAPHVCWTLATDANTFGGKSTDNNTFSGGSNDIMWSKNGDWLGVESGGAVYILQLNLSGNCAQVVNTGNLTGSGGIHIAEGPFAFSKVTDDLFYYTSTVPQTTPVVVTPYTQIQKIQILTSTTFTPSTIALLASGTTCPGLPTNWAYTHGSILGISNDDDKFGLTLSIDGGQGSDVWAVVYSQTLGCAVANFGTNVASATLDTACSITAATAILTCPSGPFTSGMAKQPLSVGGAGAAGGILYASVATYTSTTQVTLNTNAVTTVSGSSTVVEINNPLGGNYWAYCSVSCTPSTAPTGPLATTGNYCFGFGAHDSQMSGDGMTMVITANAGVAPTNCGGINVATMYSLWTVGTGITQACNSAPGTGYGGQYCDGHDSVGYNHMLSTVDNVTSIRPLSNPVAYSTFDGGTFPGSGPHGYWPSGTQDNGPWVQAMYGLLPTQGTSCPGGPNVCPVYSGNSIFVNTPGQSGRTMLGNTFSCNTNSSNAQCNGANDFYFGCQSGIISVSQDGNWAAIASGFLLGRGTDSAGHPRCDVEIGHIGS